MDQQSRLGTQPLLCYMLQHLKSLDPQLDKVNQQDIISKQERLFKTELRRSFWVRLVIFFYPKSNKYIMSIE